MKIVIGATGASGSIYLQRLLEQINTSEHEVHLVMTVHARQVADHELLTFAFLRKSSSIPTTK